VDHFAGDPRSNDERMVAGDLDIADDPAILEEQARAVRLMARFRAAYDEDPGAAQAVARELFGHLDESAFVRAPVHVDYGSRVWSARGRSSTWG
jgi:maltose O-acetyltransferase